MGGGRSGRLLWLRLFFLSSCSIMMGDGGWKEGRGIDMAFGFLAKCLAYYDRQKEREERKNRYWRVAFWEG